MFPFVSLTGTTFDLKDTISKSDFFSLRFILSQKNSNIEIHNFITEKSRRTNAYLNLGDSNVLISSSQMELVDSNILTCIC